MKPLNDKHKQFIEYYLSDPERKAKDAYMKVYPETKSSVASAAASRLLRNVNVSCEIDRINNLALKKPEISEETIIRQIVTDREDARKAKQYNVAMKANELLGRYKGMFEKMNKMSITFEDLLLRRIEENDKKDK